MNIKIKVCGMRDESNIKALVKVNPDYIGFIFYSGSERYVGDNFDTGILDFIPDSIYRVGVFVNADKNYVFEKVKAFGLNLIQLHGGESADFCRELSHDGIPVIKVFGINEGFDFNSVIPFKPFCKYFMFDTECRTYGGSSRKFDWDSLNKYDNEKPVFLSGGIGPEDADSINGLYNLNIHAVDINSRFEKAPGLKDISQVRKFIKKIKS